MWGNRAFGAEEFLRHADFPRERIAAAVSLDVFDHAAVQSVGTQLMAWGDKSRFPNSEAIGAQWGPAIALPSDTRNTPQDVRACRSDALIFARAGVPSVAVQFTSQDELRVSTEQTGLAGVTSFVAALVRDAANAPARSDTSARRQLVADAC